jgi:hypothetical protein
MENSILLRFGFYSCFLDYFLCVLCDLGGKNLFLIQRNRFIDEHDRDVILNAVDQPAVVAYQLILRLPVFQLPRTTRVPNALRASEDL